MINSSVRNNASEKLKQAIEFLDNEWDLSQAELLVRQALVAIEMARKEERREKKSHR